MDQLAKAGIVTVVLVAVAWALSTYAPRNSAEIALGVDQVAPGLMAMNDWSSYNPESGGRDAQIQTSLVTWKKVAPNFDLTARGEIHIGVEEAEDFNAATDTVEFVAWAVAYPKQGEWSWQTSSSVPVPMIAPDGTMYDRIITEPPLEWKYHTGIAGFRWIPLEQFQSRWVAKFSDIWLGAVPHKHNQLGDWTSGTDVDGDYIKFGVKFYVQVWLNKDGAMHPVTTMQYEWGDYTDTGGTGDTGGTDPGGEAFDATASPGVIDRQDGYYWTLNDPYQTATHIEIWEGMEPYTPCVIHYAETWESKTGECAPDMYPLFGGTYNDGVEVFDDLRRAGYPVKTLFIVVGPMASDLERDYIAWGRRVDTDAGETLKGNPFRWVPMPQQIYSWRGEDNPGPSAYLGQVSNVVTRSLRAKVIYK